VSGKEREKGNKVGQDGTEWETSVRGERRNESGRCDRGKERGWVEDTCQKEVKAVMEAVSGFRWEGV
jgi:hypothetical protein